jgi:orotate phosphoribosyltransferase
VTLQDFLNQLARVPEWSSAGPITPVTRATTGDTPLHAAIWSKEFDAARHLIEAGADVNAVGEDGYTPLHAAISQGHIALARRLTDRGASWDAVNAFACSVREAARRSDDPAVRALYEHEQLVSTLPGRIGHFLLESGHHSDLWLDLELLCVLPEFVRQRAAALAGRLAPREIDIVCGPLVEGAYVALMVASQLGVEFSYAERLPPSERPADAPLFQVKYELPRVLRARVQGKRVAIVNDVVSAGSAVRGTLTHLRACGATVVAIGALAIMGTAARRFAEEEGLVLESLAEFPHGLWTPAECPLCRSGVPLTTNPS